MLVYKCNVQKNIRMAGCSCLNCLTWIIYLGDAKDFIHELHELAYEFLIDIRGEKSLFA